MVHSPVVALSRFRIQPRSRIQGVRSAPTDTVGEAADGKKPHGERVCVSVYPETSSGESERYVWHGDGA